ncbi:RNA polymerase II elongation factor ELL-like isoform X1 [Poecilia latipinna]|uniref:RNA polymerase II elongation factor ELL-like isoform X1 n=1 Tax=Poecilia latipinna TaxID=48699 RepID=UPI00072E83CD|nr:PREDICTED: RNA polymerase II elongation factor ELL-like isoform X1 [Poecilia latipinna]
MSALREKQCYGLSSGKLDLGGNVSVFHVKLTDSAARAIGTFQNGKSWSSRPTITFSGNQGRIAVPCSENGNEARIFTFGVTNVARNSPHGSFDCVKQHDAGAAEELTCLGVIQKKMTVNATDDSYDKARQSMTQAEEETRSRGAIVIKNGARYQGKKVTVRAPAPALAKLTKPKHSSHSLLNNIKKGASLPRQRKGPCPVSRKSVGDVGERPLRERVMHLLALRPYKRPELILRLQKDGMADGDKDVLDAVMMEVGQLSNRDGTFVLKDGLYKELQKDWPGYTSGDQQLLKRILVRRLFQPQQNLLTVPEAQVSPLRETPNSSPAHRPKHSLLDEYADPLASKKPRISHLTSKSPSENFRLRSSKQEAQKGAEAAAAEDGRNNSLDPKRLFDSLSAVCQQEAEVAKRLEQTDARQEEPRDPEEQQKPKSDRPPPPLMVPDLSRHTVKKKKSKHKRKDHKEKEEWRDKKHRRKDKDCSSDYSNNDAPLQRTETSKLMFDSNVPQVDTDSADYLSKYTAISSHSQRQSYKLDFNKEYSEYRDLHARIDSVTQQFMDLDTQLKQLHHESHKYKTVRNKILQEYRKIKKSNPNYNQDKVRCEYLHNKLAHIKKLISDFDQQQITVDHSGPK